MQLDLTDTASIRNAVRKTMEYFGGIDVLVNNAGYCYRSSVEESVESEVMRMFQTNLFGLIELTKEVLPFMRGQHSGTIVNFSSVAALSANPASAFYASSKAASVLLKAIQSDNPPFRLLLSKQAVDFARQEYKNRLIEIDKWQSLSETTDFD